MKKLLFLLLVPFLAQAQIDAAKNWAQGTVSTGYDAAATTIVLSSGHGARFLNPSTSGAYNAFWWNGNTSGGIVNDGNAEVVRVTARSGDTLTVTRGQEGTTASTKNSAGGTYYITAGLTAQMWNTARMHLADSIVTLAAFQVGSGQAGDTTSFSTSGVYCFYYNKTDTLVITSLMGVVQRTSASLTVDVQWDDTLNSAYSTHLNVTPVPVINTAVGNEDTSFDNSMIPPGRFIWFEFPTITTKPTMLNVTLAGYKKH